MLSAGALEFGENELPHVAELDAFVSEDPDGLALAFAQEAEQDVLGADVVVLEGQGFAQ